MTHLCCKYSAGHNEKCYSGYETLQIAAIPFILTLHYRTAIRNKRLTILMF